MTAVNSTSARQEDPCRIELKSMIEKSDKPVARPPPFQNTTTTHDIYKPLWNEVMFIDRDPYYYTRRIKEAIHTRLHSDNINRDGGVEILEAWMPTIRKKHNNKRDNGSLREQISETARKCPWKMYFSLSSTQIYRTQ